jgi:ankyrin repeat protein
MLPTLHDVAKEGNLEAMRELLANPSIDVNVPEITSGKTALRWAVEYEHLEVADLLLNHKASLDVADAIGRTPLLRAARYGQTRAVQFLLNKGNNVEHRDNNGRTALLLAAREGHLEVVDLLMRFDKDKRANVNSKDKDGRTALSYASESGHTAIARLLLEDKTVEYDIQDNYYDQTPLSWAAEGGHTEIVSLLLDKEAEPDSRDRGGHTPLLWAIRNGCNEVAKLLLQKEVDVIAKDEDNWTPLSWATHLGKEPLVRPLLEKALELDSKIGTAIAGAFEDALWRANKLLPDAKKELERAKSAPSFTENKTVLVPMFGLSDDEKKKAKKEQAQAKDNVNAKRATLLDYQAIVNLILQDEYVHVRDYKKRTLLSWAAENGHDDVLQLLLSRNLSPHSIDQLRRTPISWAAIQGHRSIIETLLDYKVHPDWRDGAGRTPLSLAAGKGHEDVVSLLLDFDYDRMKQILVLPLDAKKKPAGSQNDPQGSEFEYDMGAEAIGDFKPENGVDFDSRDDKGQTPLLFAAKAGHAKVAGLLLEKGASIDIKVKDDRGEVKSLWQFLEDEINSPGTDPLKAKNLLDVRTLLESSDKYGQLLVTPMEEKASVDSEFMATIVQFLADDTGKGCGENLWRRCSVLELLNGKMIVEGEEVQNSTCKWLHVPVNNVCGLELTIFVQVLTLLR